MYKNFFFFLLSCSISLFTTAQSQKAKDSLMKIMVAEACEEMKKKDFSSMKKDDLEMEIGLAVIPVFTNHASELKDILDLDITDPENMKEFGEMLGMKLVMECPDFMRVVSGSKTFQDEIIKSGSEKKSLSISGTLVKIVPGEMTHFLIKDKQGKTQKIWWMEYFDGADKLNDVKNINKAIIVKYKETEIYNAAIKDYIKIKIAAGIE